MQITLTCPSVQDHEKRNAEMRIAEELKALFNVASESELVKDQWAVLKFENGRAGFLQVNRVGPTVTAIMRGVPKGIIMPTLGKEVDGRKIKPRPSIVQVEVLATGVINGSSRPRATRPATPARASRLAASGRRGSRNRATTLSTSNGTTVAAAPVAA